MSMSSCGVGGTAALLVVDMSVEQVSDTLYRRVQVLNNIRALCAETGNFFVCRYDCRLWIEDASSTSLSRIYPNVGIASTKGAELLPELADCAIEFVGKTTYSSFFASQLHAKLQEHNISDVFVCGINTDYCVFATALDAFYHMYNVYIVEDACSSIAGKRAHAEGIRRAQNHFPHPCIVQTQDILDQWS